MTGALIEGIIMGITLAFLIGPSFVSLLQTSIHRGYQAGLQFASGIVLSDLTLIALSYFGTLQLLNAEHNQMRLGIFGGLVVIGFGVVTFTRKHTLPGTVAIEIKMRTGRFFKYLSKGFFMNIFNPFLLFFWLGVTGLASSKYGIRSNEMLVFFAGCIGAVFITDIFKVMVAHKIKKKLNIRVLTIINRVVGISLVIFGMGLILRVLMFR